MSGYLHRVVQPAPAVAPMTPRLHAAPVDAGPQPGAPPVQALIEEVVRWVRAPAGGADMQAPAQDGLPQAPRAAPPPTIDAPQAPPPQAGAPAQGLGARPSQRLAATPPAHLRDRAPAPPSARTRGLPPGPPHIGPDGPTGHPPTLQGEPEPAQSRAAARSGDAADALAWQAPQARITDPGDALPVTGPAPASHTPPVPRIPPGGPVEVHVGSITLTVSAPPATGTPSLPPPTPAPQPTAPRAAPPAPAALRFSASRHHLRWS